MEAADAEQETEATGKSLRRGRGFSTIWKPAPGARARGGPGRRHGESPAEVRGRLPILSRIFEFMADRDPARARQTVRRIREAVMLLERHPLIGEAGGRRAARTR
ncbi:MAG: type II toxin-antitoxin system RelE/ParE family toxin [Chromatiales bacterium]|nr:type II toxin-antitoxin system RelE/ParE family toxin [Chromatiales bacterium]